MIAVGFLLAQQSAPFPMPQNYGEGLLIAFVIAVAAAYHRSQEARIKRAESQVDTVMATMSEVLTVVKRLDDARNASKQG